MGTFTEDQREHWHNRGKCCITDDEEVIDDAGIFFEFGYGSRRDLQRFDFPLIKDEVAEKVLQFIQMLMVDGRSIDEFKTDFLDQIDEKAERKKWKKYYKEIYGKEKNE